eukprot:GSChrysophyteH1.ASY1.ANO1.59.1 assembled CDS
MNDLLQKANEIACFLENVDASYPCEIETLSDLKHYLERALSAVNNLQENGVNCTVSGNQGQSSFSRAVVISGVAAALPGRNSETFPIGDVDRSRNIERIIQGNSCISELPVEVKNKMLRKNVVLLNKDKETGQNTKIPVTSTKDNINVSATLGKFSLTQYGVAASIAATMDVSVQVAVAAGLEALKDAGILQGENKGKSIGTKEWELPVALQPTTGIVYATSFPALDTAIKEVTKYFSCQNLATSEAIRLITSKLMDYARSIASDNGEIRNDNNTGDSSYEFDRKFLFRVLVLGNAQLAQIIKARGPNMQTNAACAGSTQAVALAYDMIITGRAERVVVIAGDNAASDTLMPWLGNGFRALGAATICADTSGAAMPFDKRRSGMILGAGGIGMVLESESAFGIHSRGLPFRCRLLGSLYSNSAFHGASLDRDHIAEEIERFLTTVEKQQGITREDIAKNGVYFSHETSTCASPQSSCASNELFGLRNAFGEHFKHLLILNTKGFTGHPMGVSFEDVVAAEVLCSQQVPPIANLDRNYTDEFLGSDLNLSSGGKYNCKYALRFAAGFGSQIALALYGSVET